MTNAENWFGRYRLLRRISVGGMAEVWHAKSYAGVVFEKEVALKRILPHIAEDEDLLAMFMEEARLAAKLDHPNVCHIYELGKTVTSYYLTMEYIYGADLRSVQKQLRRYDREAPPEQVAAIGLGVAKGLAHAHGLRSENGASLNLVHRDVSPQNVMLAYSGDVKLIDFGIAKASGRALETQVGVLKGKLGYMAPEQLERLELDGRVDQFSLGILLWETLAGQRLFTAPSPVGAIELIRKCEVPDIRDIRPDCPERLADVVHRCLQKDRDRRFDSCALMAIELETMLKEDFGLQSTKAAIRDWVGDLFPESGHPELTEHEVKTLFSAEDRGEEVTDPRVVDDATEVFIPDTTRIDIYRRQIEELLERKRDTDHGKSGTDSGGDEVSYEVKNSVNSGGQEGWVQRWLVDAIVFLIVLGLGYFVWRTIEILV